jgi:hypothetical protein
MNDMTKSLEEAVAKVRELPEADQDEAAEMLLSVAARKAGPVALDEETRAAIREGANRHAAASSQATRTWRRFSSGMA